MNAFLAILGVGLVLLSIPLGFMLAPLVVGVILVYVVARRADGALQAELSNELI